ncbi:heterokaryon incompatibility protein-domain-containing protein [Nemania sp. NC0429]|nr:heterokaryon incompatibility protein-domain-containing protein [Nemania sp. NC0429]
MLGYQPLLDGQIRLLAIRPGRFEDDIQCTLTTVRLDDELKYEALSYVWGDTTDTRNVFVQVFDRTDTTTTLGCLRLCDRPGPGVAVPVTRNLFTALRRFRRVDIPRTIWVDALCINQHDLKERSKQISLMSRIFSQCEACQVWLGEPGDVPLLGDNFTSETGCSPSWGVTETRSHLAALSYDIKEAKIYSVKAIDDVDLLRGGDQLSVPGAFVLLELLSKSGRDKDRHLIHMPFYRITEYPGVELCPQWHNARRSLVNICSRAWWRRTWTVQEAILPRTCVINIGNHHALLELFADACRYFLQNTYLDQCCRQRYDELCDQRNPGETAFSIALAAADDLTRLRESYRMSKEHYKDPRDPLHREIPNGVRLPKHQDIARRRQAADPRDLVYGYLGIFPELLPPGQQPDYIKETTGSLYAIVTKQYIQHNENLQILESVLPPLQRARKDLPSWAIDWSHNMGITAFYHMHNLNWRARACGDFSLSKTTDLFEEAQVLPLDVVAIGTIVWTSSLPPLERKTGTIAKKFQLWQMAAGILDTEPLVRKATWNRVRWKVKGRVRRWARPMLARKVIRNRMRWKVKGRVKWWARPALAAVITVRVRPKAGAKAGRMKKAEWKYGHSRKGPAPESTAISNDNRALRFWETIFQGNPCWKTDMDNVDTSAGPLFLDEARAWFTVVQNPTLADTSIWSVNLKHRKQKKGREQLPNRIQLWSMIQDVAFCVIDVPGAAEPKIASCMRKSTQPGDVVVVAKGAELPLILRMARGASPHAPSSLSVPTRVQLEEVAHERPPAADPRETVDPPLTLSSSDRYHFIGHAYVDGIMHGQAVNNDSKWQSVYLV